MTRNKSARSVEKHRERVERIYSKENPHGNMDYDSMRHLAEADCCRVSSIICGYMRQPINYSGSDESISGVCSLKEDGSVCSYHVPQSVQMPYTCQIYQTLMLHKSASECSECEEGMLEQKLEKPKRK